MLHSPACLPGVLPVPPWQRLDPGTTAARPGWAQRPGGSAGSSPPRGCLPSPTRPARGSPQRWPYLVAETALGCWHWIWDQD